MSDKENNTKKTKDRLMEFSLHEKDTSESSSKSDYSKAVDALLERDKE